MKFQFGIDRLLEDKERLKQLKTARVGLVAHPASITSGNQHSIDALIDAGCNVVRAFGPQHGMRGDVQDNMIETDDYVDPVHQLPVISLYGTHRYPTPEMLEDLDIIIYDLQDIGCRIYTYITTLKYMVKACAEHDIELWVCDRPNPAGRPVDGLYLEAGEESFVGAHPIPTRHGLTVAELARFYNDGDVTDLSIVEMAGYGPETGPGYGWPVDTRPWINPSPNAASLNMARCFPGSVLLEGTTVSEGRGSTTPLEVFGAPDLDILAIITTLHEVDPECLGGVYVREHYFIPTFHKHEGQLCRGLQIHTEVPGYDHNRFKPYRLYANLLKILRQHLPDYEIWRHHDYEYELDRIPIDVINGGPALRTWIDDQGAGFDAFHQDLADAESRWLEERAPYLLYKG